jgi:hypothetical protein
MKNRILLTFLLGLLLVVGWKSKLEAVLQAGAGTEEYLQQAQKCRELGLYEAAVEHYEEAMAITAEQDTMNQIVETYELFYAEEQSSDVASELLSALEQARGLYPQELSYWEREVGLSLETEDYDSAKKVCKAAFDEGVDSDTLQEYWHTIRYSYQEGTRYYMDYRDAVNGYYLVDDAGQEWSWNTVDGEDDSSVDFALLGYVGDDGIYAAKTEDGSSFFYDTSYVKRGVINQAAEWFGIYAQGYCPVKYGQVYALVDLYGESLADGLAYAGSFQNGYACISKAEGTWSLINSDGKEKELPVARVICNEAGQYIGQERVLASDGEAFGLYDEDFKRVGDFSAADVDVLTENGWFAFQDDSGKWGFADMEGQVMIEPQYEAAKSFSNGVAAVSVDGKWGYINQANELIVEPQFSACSYATSYGLCFVQDDTGYYRTITFRDSDLLLGE